MRYSTLFAPTLREVSAEVELASHRLLLRAGFIRQLSAGVYSFLPLGWRVLNNIAGIIRAEMERAGAQELLLPVMSPRELWAESGRESGPMCEVLIGFKDRKGTPYYLGPTHEEVITDLLRRDVRSYRALPLILFQIQLKFRDEPRPRGGLLRCREFLMKDAYSFDRDEAGLDAVYRRMHAAYLTIFRRCGLEVTPVEASSGAIGGKETQEFMLLSEVGEDTILALPAVRLCGQPGNRRSELIRGNAGGNAESAGAGLHAGCAYRAAGVRIPARRAGAAGEDAHLSGGRQTGGGAAARRPRAE